MYVFKISKYLGSTQQLFILDISIWKWPSFIAKTGFSDQGWEMQVYGYSHKYLEGSLTTYSFYKTSVVNPAIGPVTSLDISYWPGLQYQICIPSFGANGPQTQ